MTAAKDETPTLNIPEFGLYGDAIRSQPFRFAHVERLKDRNALSKWRIERHRHPHLHQISIVLSGSCSFVLDGVDAQADESSVVYIKAGVVHEFSYEPEAHGYIVTCSLDLMNEIRRLEPGAFDFQNTLQMSPGRPIISSDFAKQIDQICEILCMYSSPPENRHLDEAVLLMAYLHKLLRRSVNLLPAANFVRSGSDRDLLERFKRLLRNSLSLEGEKILPVCNARTVEYFSDLLKATPYQLNRCCKAFVGCGAKNIIKDAVASEATRLLLYSPHTIKQISEFLGYSNPSHFIRFFSQSQGMTPNQFRKMHRTTLK